MCRVLYVSNPTVDLLVGPGWLRRGVGGPAYYGAWAAVAMGCREIYCLGVVGSEDASLIISHYGSRGVSLIARAVEGCSTRFRLDYTATPRRVELECWPGSLPGDLIVEIVDALQPDIVITSPVYSEVPLEAISRITGVAEHHLVDVQGFVRSFGSEVFSAIAGSAPYIHVSSDDTRDVGALEVLGTGSVVVYTKGPEGVELLVGGKRVSYSLPRVVEADPTGSGDVFSTAFMISIYRGLALGDAVDRAIRVTLSFLEEKIAEE